jgi:predicted HicB family RNase H-like nuclease
MPRSLRIDPDLWKAAVAKTQEEGTTVTAVVEKALRRYVARRPK